MALREIVLPETKPETEWIDGHPVQKVSPTDDHGLVQRRVASWLGGWADERRTGRVASEWRFRVAPPGEVVRPLIPDIAYLSYETLPRGVPHDAVALPLGAPTVAVEILSPDDRKRHLASKIRTFLAAGTSAIVVVDPRRAIVTVHDRDGARTYAGDDVFTHPALPGFALDLARLFAEMD